LSNVGNPEEMSKTQAADYIGVCRATFDNYVRDGYLPKGVHVEGFKELRWYKCDLDMFKIKNQTYNITNSSIHLN
jgi:predicted DNA-binding transcriptional regulator AlpA